MHQRIITARNIKILQYAEKHHSRKHQNKNTLNINGALQRKNRKKGIWRR